MGQGTNNNKELDTFTEPPALLAEERQQTSFPIRELTYYLDGGRKKTLLNEEIMRSIERDPIFQNDDQYDLSYEQQRELTFERVGALTKHVLAEADEEGSHQRFSIINMLDSSTGTRAGVHFGLFFGSIRGSGNDEQLAYWIDQGCGQLQRFFGCFAMTEMGHGSNVAGLETTATFDKQTDEFVVNTPNVAATKWWIGGAAHTATHSVVYARLIVDGKDYGVKNFVVQLRSTQDHSLRPGVAIGDIGKKMGRDGIDNGWIQFTNVRIPRQYMLMKYSKVDAEGNVTEPPLNQLSYAALVGGRVMMVNDSFMVANRFLTIAIRYAAIRRQFASTPGQPETRLLDYTYHQRRLIPRLAYSVAMRAAAERLFKFYIQTNKKVQSIDQDDKPAMQAAIEDAKELFSISSGMKAFSTWATAEIIDQCRQACGGHGYSGYNGFGQGYNDWVVQCTWEGDNNILTLSTGRSLILSGIRAREGKPVGRAIEYMSRAEELSALYLNGRDIREPAVLVEAWETASSRAITAAADAYLELLDQGYNEAQAFEELSQERFETARIHTRLFIIKSFFESIRSAEGSESIKPVLRNMAVLFGLWSIENDAASFLSSGYLTPQDLAQITRYITELNKLVRKDAIGITDAFNLSDFFINAPIGNYDGDAYKHYFNKVTRRNPNRNTKAPYHDTKIRPFLHRDVTDEDDLEGLDDL